MPWKNNEKEQNMSQNFYLILDSSWDLGLEISQQKLRWHSVWKQPGSQEKDCDIFFKGKIVSEGKIL